jgi:hypothetical protein
MVKQTNVKGIEHPPFNPTRKAKRPPRRGNTLVISVSIPVDDGLRIKRMAEDKGTTVSAFLRAAVEYVVANAPEYVGIE